MSLRPDPFAPLPAPDAPLRLLALDTSTSRMSLAVGIWEAGAASQGGAPRMHTHEVDAGNQSSALLIPAVHDLLQQAGLDLHALDALVFGAGPGSFTGLRTACAVAQGLATGIGRPLLPVDTLLAMAEDWRLRQHRSPAAGTSIWTLLDARMHEIYAACWRWQPGPWGPAWQAVQPAGLVAPAAVPDLPGLRDGSSRCAGNVEPVYGDELGLPVPEAVPDAAAMLHLAPGLLAAGHAVDPALALPRYVRDKVALTTAEREQARAAQSKP